MPFENFNLIKIELKNFLNTPIWEVLKGNKKSLRYISLIRPVLSQEKYLRNRTQFSNVISTSGKRRQKNVTVSVTVTGKRRARKTRAGLCRRRKMSAWKHPVRKCPQGSIVESIYLPTTDIVFVNSNC